MGCGGAEKTCRPTWGNQASLLEEVALVMLELEWSE